MPDLEVAIVSPEALLDEGLRLGRPRKTRAQRRSDFAALARMVVAACRLTPANVRIIFAVVRHGSMERAAKALRPRSKQLHRKLSTLYRSKLRDLLEDVRSENLDWVSVERILESLGKHDLAAVAWLTGMDREERALRKVFRKERPRPTSAQRRKDFLTLARIALVASRLTPREIEVIFAVAAYESVPRAAEYLEPSKPRFRWRISKLYEKKLRDLVDFSRSTTDELDRVPRTYARKNGFRGYSNSWVIPSWSLFGFISRFPTPSKRVPFENL